MYAHRRLYVRNWNGQSPAEQYEVKLTKGGKPVEGIKSRLVAYLEEEVMYWRKANHIHAWFVDNAQQFEDDCGSYEVEWEKLQELVDACKKVIKSSKLVPGLVTNGIAYDENHPEGIPQRETGKVIENTSMAKELLPTRSGFFFGSEDYDQDYLDDTIQTHDWAVRMLNDHANGVPGEILYSSSW